MQKDWPRLLRMLNDELGYTVREGNPSLGYNVYYADLSSWKLRLTNRTPVLWVKAKDMDGVTAEHLMLSLADVVRERNLSRQIVLVLLDGNSLPLFRHKTSLNYNLVLIGGEEQKRIITSRRPSGELLDMISAQVPISFLSPYETSPRAAGTWLRSSRRRYSRRERSADPGGRAADRADALARIVLTPRAAALPPDFTLKPLIVTAYTGVNCLGEGVQAWWRALASRRSGLRACAFEDAALPTFVGQVDGVERVALPGALARYDCRNNRLAQLGLAQDGFADAVAAARERYGPRRVAVVLGTSTSGVGATEHEYRHRDPATGALPADFHYAETQNTFSLAI